MIETGQKGSSWNLQTTPSWGELLTLWKSQDSEGSWPTRAPAPVHQDAVQGWEKEGPTIPKGDLKWFLCHLLTKGKHKDLVVSEKHFWGYEICPVSKKQGQNSGFHIFQMSVRFFYLAELQHIYFIPCLCNFESKRPMEGEWKSPSPCFSRSIDSRAKPPFFNTKAHLGLPEHMWNTNHMDVEDLPVHKMAATVGVSIPHHIYYSLPGRF